ncbi:MAG TPA: hypothetical protein PK868_09995 [Phycicoccus sp.]|jgi:uncharacterized protein YukE|nr:hypothetical protein [Phycicoccus sp.]HQK31345.1 hypothetical protein [Phycicoccus sp.]
MSDDMWELEQAAERCMTWSVDLRAQASMVRATMALPWEGAGSGVFREKTAQRWAALLRLAEQVEQLGVELRQLAWTLEAA